MLRLYDLLIEMALSCFAKKANLTTDDTDLQIQNGPTEWSY
jgi:hypothetical protein